MIKRIITICLVLIISEISYSQSVNFGDYNVGFKCFKTTDDSRNYIIDNDTVKRPMLIHFWYPAQNNSDVIFMTFKDYIDLIAIREDFEKNQSDIDQMTEGFVNAYLGFSKQLFGIDTAVTTTDVLNSSVQAVFNAEPIIDEFPLIIYAPSNSKSAVQNHIICEYLASNGYYVVSVGSAGYETLQRFDQKKATLAQVQDMEFIVTFVKDSLNIDYSNIGLFGYSTGSMATIIFQMRTPEVKAVASLDGSHEYAFYRILNRIDEFDFNRANVPYLMITNKFKDLSIFPFYSSIPLKDKYLYKMTEIDHNGFISYWQQFANCSKNSDVNNVSESYTVICSTVNLFFNVTLKSGSDIPRKFEVNNSDLIYKDSTDYTIIAQWLNLLLQQGVDSAIIYLNSNEILFKDKTAMINTVGKMFLGNDNDIAIKIFKANSEINPNAWESFYNLALAYKESKQKDEAIVAILEAENISNNNDDIKNLYDEITKIE